MKNCMPVSFFYSLSLSLSLSLSKAHNLLFIYFLFYWQPVQSLSFIRQALIFHPWARNTICRLISDVPLFLSPSLPLSLSLSLSLSPSLSLSCFLSTFDINPDKVTQQQQQKSISRLQINFQIKFLFVTLLRFQVGNKDGAGKTLDWLKWSVCMTV